MAETGEIKDTERIRKGGNGVRDDAGVHTINVMDWFRVCFFSDGQRKSEQHEDWIKADSHQWGTDARVFKTASWELMVQDSFQMAVALTDINDREFEMCLTRVPTSESFNIRLEICHDIGFLRRGFHLLGIPLEQTYKTATPVTLHVSACPWEECATGI